MKKLVIIMLLLVGCKIVPPEEPHRPKPPVKKLRVHIRRDGSIVEDKIKKSKWWRVAEELKARHPEWTQSVDEIAGELEYQEFLIEHEKWKKRQK